MKSNSTLNRVSQVGFLSKDMFPHWVRLLIWSLQLDKPLYKLLYRRLDQIWSSNGPTFLCLYTKECVRVLQSFVSGHPIYSTNEFIVGLVGGLPSILPGKIRTLIREGDSRTIRGVLSLLQVYRVLKVPGKLKLGTITDPFKGLEGTLPKYEVLRAIRELCPKRPRLSPVSLKYLSTAGPNHRTSMLGIWKDIIAWRDSPSLGVLKNFILKFPGGEEFLLLLNQELDFVATAENCSYKLGRLAEKEEAAGKIRVFGITDSITQSVMAPLSDFVFDILRQIPSDGTFNQDGPLKRLIYLTNVSKEIVNPTFYSYDLSAATDRLPIALQTQVLSAFFGEEFSEEWREILVGRDWYHKGTPLRYAVGQPMGALSSWAMLALTHHVIVRLCALRLNKPNFTHYALLGDDIVIADEAVAHAYHALMTTVLGVDINLSKSLKSANSFEFAKRLIRLDGELSPVGAKNLLVGLKTLKGIPSILLDLVNKNFALSEESVTNMYKTVPTVRKSQLEKMLWLVKGPFGFIPTADGLTASMKLTNSLSAVMMDSLLSSMDEAFFKVSLSRWESMVKKAGKTVYNLRTIQSLAGVDIDLTSSPLLKKMLSDWVIKTDDLLRDKPVRRIIFDDPYMVFTNYYRATWMSEMMYNITYKIKKRSGQMALPLMDPFETDSILLPLSSNRRADNFWALVKEIEREKSVLRGFKGW